MSQKSLERATVKVKLKLAEAKALEKKQTAGKLDEPGVGRVKAEIGRKLTSIENLKQGLASIESLESELKMAKAEQKKLVTENDSLDKRLAAMNVEADSLETE